MIRHWTLEKLYGWLTSYMSACGYMLYFGGGGKAPAPDPLIGQSALAQAQLGKEAFDWYKQEYNNAKPAQERLNALAEEVQQQMVESGRLNNEYSKDYYNYMTDVFRPLEKSIVDNANNYDTAGRREQEAAQGLADVTQSFDRQREMADRNNERMGINPNSGNAQALDQQMDVQQAVAGASAMNKGRKQAEMMGNAMKMDAASLGRNLPSNQATSQQVANSSATGAVNVGTTNMANNRAQADMVGAGFRTNMQGLTNQANILNQQYNSELNAWQANNANNNAAMAGLGQAVGTGAMLWKMSDVNIKENIEPIDEDAALEGVKNTEISSWSYDKSKAPEGADNKPHIGAMAQDLQKNLGDTVSNGKEIDLISVAGANMAATKALANKVEGLEALLSGKEYKKGGKVSGAGTSTSDSIPARLSNGEFVLNAEATKMIGLDTLNKLNKKGLEQRKGVAA